jgi:glycosyltransferase involved in cell wall biosynthesis
MLFSIIIPCYNHGRYITNAINSLKKIKNIPYEIIIVDDGSSDQYTLEILRNLRSEGLTVISQKNGGPSSARNNGIKHAKGKYILPLDADDMIRVEYLEKAKEIFESDDSISIVYSNYLTFGDRCFLQRYREFNLQDLLIANSVGSACFYKKEAWEAVNGYDETFRKGWEDYDLYLNFAFHGFRFKHIDIIGYDYYIHTGSRERTFLKSSHNVNNTLDKLEQKYKGFFSRKALHDYVIYLVKRPPLYFFVKVFIAAFLPGLFNFLVKKGKMRKYVTS